MPCFAHVKYSPNYFIEKPRNHCASEQGLKIWPEKSEATLVSEMHRLFSL